MRPSIIVEMCKLMSYFPELSVKRNPETSPLSY